MMVLSLLTALALGGGVFLATFALLVERPRSPLVMPRRGGAAGSQRDAITATRKPPQILQSRERGLLASLPFGLGERAARKLAEAGSPIAPGRFLLFCVVAGIVLPVVGLAMFAGGDGGTAASLMALGAVVLGPAAPYVWLSGRVARRRSAILESLPAAFDLLTTCVEAGLGLDAALARVAGRMRGPFGDELTRTVRELGMGRSRQEALRDLARRTKVEDLELFVSAVLQAEQMGSSIGQVLRVQSEQMRRRRRQRAEQQAHRAPVKMMLPLVTMIFPSLFVVILGPAAIDLLTAFPR